MDILFKTFDIGSKNVFIYSYTPILLCCFKLA
jgi:hypothetical protein